MTSFIELPRLQFGGRPTPSVYVNVADIVCITEMWDGQTKVDVRDLGTEGMTAAITTFVPIGALLNLLGELSSHPGVRSWAHDTKKGWSVPIAAAMQAGAEKERAAR